MNFKQFQETRKSIKHKYPLKPNHNPISENSDYGDYLVRCKNSYYSFDTADSNDIIYIFDSFKAKYCVDGDYVIESELCYECVDVLKAYNSTYLNYCGRIYNSHFCWDCGDSNNLFGCVHISYKEYCIFNQQYTKEEYEAKIKELLKRPAEESLAKMWELARNYPVSTTYVSFSENCDYNNHVDISKNMYLCFDCAHSEDCAYSYDAHHNKNCFDMTQAFHSQFCYECADSSSLNNCHHMKDCNKVFDSGFCNSCSNSNHLFGCYGLDEKEYCILNKQYAKEEYEKQIKEIMDSYGVSFK